MRGGMEFLAAKSLLLVAIANAFLTQLTNVTGIPLADFYPFGSGNNDIAVATTNDGSSPRISLSTPFPFFNEDHSTLYVNSNGAISFGLSVWQYTPDPFPLGGDRILIAPYWADVDTTGTGTVWYRETTGTLPTFLNASVQDPGSVLLFIATWDHVGYFNNHSDKTNTFQCILATNGITSYVAFLYADDEIQWTTGDLSGGSGGLGGTEAHVGFNAGDGVNFANVPGSQTPEIINISNTSNTGIPGVWIFRVDGAEIVPTNSSNVVFQRDAFPEEFYNDSVCSGIDCLQSQYFQMCTDLCVESETVGQNPCTASLCDSYQFVLDTCNLSCNGDVGMEACDVICNIPTYMGRFNDSCVMELCGDYLDPSSCPFDDIDCTGNDAISCRSLCVNVNITEVAPDCAQTHADLCKSFLNNITNSDGFDSSTAQTVVSTAENFEDDLSSSLDYIDILFEYFDNFTDEAITYLQPEETEDILNVFDDYFSDRRIEDWENLQSGDSQNILQHIETLGNLVANGSMQSMQYNGSNIVLAVEKPNRDNVVEGSYQLSEDTQDMFIMVNIPVDLLCEDSRIDEDCSSVSTFLVKNLPNYLEGVGSNGSVANSILLSTQVLPRISSFQEQLNDNPIVLEFDQFQVGKELLPFCAFWDFAIDDWSTVNVTTVPQTVAGSRVVCNTRHLTSFAVLVQVHQAEEDFALSVATYIGCGISIVCLVLTIFILILFRKKLDKGVLLYIHLNLAIALLIALVVFVAGIQSVTSVPWLCTLVAVLLHYFFLSVFCWMLAEGIMLYLLVVRVFGTAAQKWYYLLILGWGVPLPVVVISAAVLHKDYGNSDYCWISADVSEPAIWLFVGPLILIIMINTVILILTVVSMVRGKKKGGAEQEVKTRTLVKTAIKGTLIFLPLLGLTWIFGVFAVNKNTVAFAWLFTIFNSLQGIFIFTLHVLRNNHILSIIKRLRTYICARGSRLSSTTSGTIPGAKNFRLNMKYRNDVHTEDLSFANLLSKPVPADSYEKTPLTFGEEAKANENP